MAVVRLELDGRTREILGRILRVIDLLPHLLGEHRAIMGTRPLETGDMRRYADRLHRRQRLARFGEQVPHDERRMTHHVIEHAAALQLALPEPWAMGSAMLFGGARKIRTAGERCRTCPDNMFSACNIRREHLIFEISVQHTGLFYHLDHAASLGDVARQRLFAGDADEFAFA